MPTLNMEIRPLEQSQPDQVPGFEAEMVGEGLIYAELGTAAFILAEAEAQYLDYVATLPQEQQDALAQAERDLRSTDRDDPLDASFLTQPLDKATKDKRAAAMGVRDKAWASAAMQADTILEGAQARQIQYFHQVEMDRIIRELIDGSAFGTDFVPSKRKKGKKPYISHDWTANSTGLPLAA